MISYTSSYLFPILCCLFLFFHDTSTTEIYTYSHTLSLHDALPISSVLLLLLATTSLPALNVFISMDDGRRPRYVAGPRPPCSRSEEHTSELQSLMRISYAVFCLKKKTKIQYTSYQQ